MKTNPKDGKLNVDIATAISELEAMLNHFRLKKEIYKLFFRGKGVEFDGYRDFTPDDDAQRIDWKTSSRAQKLLVKKYIEERDLKIIFVIDVGENMVFGSTEKIKCEFITELVGAFAKVILNSNDKIGFILFSNQVVQFVEAKAGRKQFELFIDTLSKGSNYGGTTDMDNILDFIIEFVNKSTSSIILVSDFLRITHETEKKINLVANKFETIAIRVRDPLDMTLPNVEGEIVIEDSETKQQIIINPKIAKSSYERYTYQQAKVVEEIFKKTNMDYLDLTTDKYFAEPLALFLQKRLKEK